MKIHMKKILATIVAFAVIVSFIPVTAANVNADSKTYTGTFPSLPKAGEVIAQTAIKLAWPYGTPSSKYSYNGGSATDAFKTAIDAVYPDRSSWGKQPRAGASCDVFVGTTVRYSGYDTSVPRGLRDALKYYKKHPEKWTATGVSKVADMEPGDVIVWKKSSGVGHTCIYVEINNVGYLAEAHYNSKKYGCIDKKAFNYNKSSYSSFNIYRANDDSFRGSLSKGYSGTNVERLQKFLNWAGFDCGSVDGSFGSKTEKAVKAFQKAVNVTADGEFGKSSLAAAKEYKLTTSSNENVTKKSTYSGTFPKVTSKGLKYKDNSKQVKYLQKFLNWYGKFGLDCKGYFGKNTRAAVKKFQKKEGLTVDGVFGKQCLKRAKKVKK